VPSEEIGDALAYLQRRNDEQGEAAASAEAQRRNVANLHGRYEPPADLRVKRGDAGGVPVDVLTGRGMRADRTVLFLHGGGYVSRPAETHRDLASRVGRARPRSSPNTGSRPSTPSRPRTRTCWRPAAGWRARGASRPPPSRRPATRPAAAWSRPCWRWSATRGPWWPTRPRRATPWSASTPPSAPGGRAARSAVRGGMALRDDPKARPGTACCAAPPPSSRPRRAPR
jgi:hypothetical protein